MEDSNNKYIALKEEEEEDYILEEPDNVKRPKSRHLKVYMVTWNTNSKPPPPNLNQLFIYTADIYAIGLQELGSYNWLEALDEALSHEDVVRIKKRNLQGITNVVYVQRHLLDYVTHIESEITKTGLGGMWGNKGGVSIRFDIYGVNVVIVNSHLAAHMENVAQRVQDVNQIVDGQKFKDTDVNNILDHDYIFWMGDMNFRLDNTSFEQALVLIERNNIQAMLSNDQLKSVMMEGLIFPGFKEAPIQFKPSYKFDVGTDVYDTSSKKRVPAYCDRVVYFYHDATYGKRDHLNVKVCDYRAHTLFQDSDHKPVSCTLDFTGLSRPPSNPVTFKVNKSVSRTAEFRVAYTSRDMELNTSDWIGLYYANFIDFDTYTSYRFVTVTGSPYNGIVKFSPLIQDNVPKGAKIVFVYFSKRNSICGISRVTTVKE